MELVLWPVTSISYMFVSHHSGFLINVQKGHRNIQDAVDWILSDPSSSAASADATSMCSVNIILLLLLLIVFIYLIRSFVSALQAVHLPGLSGFFSTAKFMAIDYFTEPSTESILMLTHQPSQPTCTSFFFLSSLHVFSGTISAAFHRSIFSLVFMYCELPNIILTPSDADVTANRAVPTPARRTLSDPPTHRITARVRPSLPAFPPNLFLLNPPQEEEDVALAIQQSLQEQSGKDPVTGELINPHERKRASNMCGYFFLLVCSTSPFVQTLSLSLLKCTVWSACATWGTRATSTRWRRSTTCCRQSAILSSRCPGRNPSLTRTNVRFCLLCFSASASSSSSYTEPD